MSATPPNAHTRIVALGAGRMGRGIAIAFAWAGWPVDIVDFKPRDASERARIVRQNTAELQAAVSAWLDVTGHDATLAPTLLSRIRLYACEEGAAVLAAADIVFEGVTETLEAKRDAFARLCPLLRSDSIVASTTSTILVTDLVPLVTHPERLLNAHWLNPAWVIPLVELSVHPGTASSVRARVVAALEAIGKVPVVCGPAPGYIVPRLQALVMNEAARMVEEGVATAEDIDRATRYGMGLRFAALGVVEFIDFGGNDILYHASRYLAQAIDPVRYAVPGIVERLMHEGRNGLRDGHGFFDWRSRDAEAYRRDVLSRTLSQLKLAGLLRAPVG